MIKLTVYDWAVIALYGAAMFAVAFWAMSRIFDCGSFLLGKRRLGKLMMMAATFAGGTNANHPMAVAAATYKEGFSGMWLSLIWILLTPFLWMYPPVVRRLRIVTMVDIVQLRFGPLMGYVFKIVGVILMPFSMAFGLKSAAVVVTVMTGGALDDNTALLVIVIPTLIYTLMGGIIAAYATDILQGLLIVVLSFLMIPFAISRGGGIDALDMKIADEFTHLVSSASGQGYGLLWIFWFLMGVLFAFPISTGVGSAGAKNEMSARLSVVGLVIKRFCTVGWGLAGLLAIALYAGTSMVQKPDEVFAVAAADLLPVVLRGVMVASMLAAVMSSLDGALIGFAGTIVNNFYQQHFVRNASPAHYLVVARTVAFVGAILGYVIAASSVDDLVRYATFVEPMNGLVGMSILVALMWRRTTGVAALLSVIVMFPLFFIGQRWNFNQMPWGITHMAQGIESLYGWLGARVQIVADKRLPIEISNPLYLIPGLATLIGVSLLTRQHNPRQVEEFYARLETPLGQEHRLAEAGFVPDDLAHLDQEVIVVPEKDRDWSRRMLLPDLLRFPWLIATGQARWSDYRWDWIGLAGSVLFVAGFLYGVEALGALFRGQ